MSEGDDSYGTSLPDSVDDHFQRLPASNATSAHPRFSPGQRLFNRERSVHEILGSSELADILLWRKRHVSAGILAAATVIWIVFEWLDFRLLSVTVKGLLLLLGFLFLWSNVAAFMNRPPPPVKNVRLSEETAVRTAAALRQDINRWILVLHEVALGKDLKLFILIEVSLWLLSVVGGWCDFLTLVYIGIVLSLTVPVFYEKYDDKIDHFGQSALRETQNFYEKGHGFVMSKINRGPVTEKKTQ